jgi:flagellar biosynthesis protein FlhF
MEWSAVVMKIKSYFASSVEEAMSQARHELGEDAMLVNSRKASVETRHLGTYEVVFASDMPPGAPEEGPAAASPPLPEPNDRLARQMFELKRELEGMRRTISRSALAPSAWRDSNPDVSDAFGTLTANEVLPELAREIIQAAEARISKAGSAKLPHPFRGALIEELESRIRVEAVLGRREGRPRIVALVGPPGAGKTTTLVKLAVNYGLAARRPVLLLSMDTYRVAAAEQLRSYSAILGVGFQLVETVAALAQAIEENRGKELIFLDTPGLGTAEMASYSALAQFLSTREDIDTHLTVSCSMKTADLSRVVDGFELFRPRRIIFTKVDETASFGTILNESVRTGKPVSFLATGQRIPEDLEAATKSRVAEFILTGTGVEALSAA